MKMLLLLWSVGNFPPLQNNSFLAHETSPHLLSHPVLCVSAIALPLNRLSFVISSFRDWPALQCEDQLIKARQAGESLTHEISVSLAAQQLQVAQSRDLCISSGTAAAGLTSRAGSAFVQYSEAVLSFPPTYRYHKGACCLHHIFAPVLC